jgi:2-polyprenyl-3-methyl-5-hydroxy-6-metoxy-1,4-benzoquinol methylase
MNNGNSLKTVIDIVTIEKQQTVLKNLKRTLVLDAGCGTGLFSIEASRRGFAIIAIDLSRKQLKHSKKLFSDEAVCIPLIRCSLTHLPLRDSIFDSVMCCDVIEHVPMINYVFSEFNRILRTKGNVCLTTPNGYGAYGLLFDGVLRNVPLLSYLSKTSKLLRTKNIETHHVYRFTSDVLKTLACSNNFKVIKFANTEFFATMQHYIFKVVLRGRQEILNQIQRLDLETAVFLPLIVGSEWFLCLEKS